MDEFSTQKKKKSILIIFGRIHLKLPVCLYVGSPIKYLLLLHGYLALLDIENASCCIDQRVTKRNIV